MSFSDIKNNDRIVREMQAAVRGDRVHQAYILEGPWNADKFALAKSFVKAIMCEAEPGIGCERCPTCLQIEAESYADLTVIEAELDSKGGKVKSIRDNMIEQVIVRLMKKPLGGDRNVAIIKDADTITHRAFNRLLKTLEEPPAGTVIVLISENAQNLPVTIRSRCLHYRVQPFAGVQNGTDESAKKIVQKLRGAEPYYKVQPLIDEACGEKKDAYIFLDSMEEELRNILLSGGSTTEKTWVYEAVHIIEETRDRIKRNINIKYAMKDMAIRIGGYN